MEINTVTSICKEIKITNIVSTANLDQKIQLSSFDKFKNLKSSFENYPCGFVNIPDIQGTIIVYSSGKMI